MKEVTLRIYFNIDSHHLSQHHSGNFTQHLSSSWTSVEPSVLISCSIPEDYISSLTLYSYYCVIIVLSKCPLFMFGCLCLCLPNTQTQNRMSANSFDLLTDNNGSGVWFCIHLGRRHQWRHSAAVTAAGKLVISNLVYLSPLQWGWSLSPVDNVHQQHAPWAASPESRRVARASVVSFTFNKITCEHNTHISLCVRATVTLDDIGPRYYLLKVHLISIHVPSFTLSSNEPWKLIGSAIINDISISLNSARRSWERGLSRKKGLS